MSFRTIVVNSRSKLSLQLGYLVCRGEQETRVHLNEISTIIVQNTGVSITTSLLVELNRKNINVIFCDEKAQPSFSITPFAHGHRSFGTFKKQIAWDEETKAVVWSKIVYEKILNQRQVLAIQGKEEAAKLLDQYLLEIEKGDVTNREGHAAKVYFNALFGTEFSRRKDHIVNGPLNYGYSIILSAINRYLVASGYLTQLGIWHDSEFNQFNLGCDLMEPIRPFVDLLTLQLDDLENFKPSLANILNIKVKFNDKNTLLDTALQQYVYNFIKVMNESNPNVLKFPKHYELSIYANNNIF